MNSQDFFKYGNAYARYQQGLIDPGDPSAGEPHSTWRFSRNNRSYKGPRDYSSDEQRKMAVDRDTLQLAKTIGPDLTLEEFKQLRDQVEEVHKRYQDQESSAMTNRAKQQAIWSLPEKLKRSNPTHFSPLRFKDGTPVDLDHKDPAGTEAKLKSVPYSQVEHDPRLRDAWQAAQDGHLAALMEAGEGIGGDLSAALGGVNTGPQESLTEPLKKLLQPNEPEQPWSGQPVGWYKGPSAPTLQSGVKQEIPAPSSEQPATQGSESPPVVGEGILDKIQAGMDAVGIADPTPVVDGTNAAISLVRALTEPERAGEHLTNAAVSAVSMFPYIGDTAKAWKYGRKATGAAGVAAKGTGAARASGGSGGFGAMLGGLAGGAVGGLLGGMLGGGSGGGGGGQGGAGGVGNQGGGNSGGGSSSSFFQGAANDVLDKLGALGRGFKKLIGWLEDVDAASRRLIEQNRHLAQYDGSLAASYTRLDAGRLQRDIDQAGAMAGPMGRLTAAQDEYESTMQEFMQPFQQLQTDVQAVRVNAITGIVKLIELIEPMSEILQWWYGKNKVEGAAKNATEFAAREAERFLKAKKL